METPLAMLVELLREAEDVMTTRTAVNALQQKGVRMADASETVLEAVEDGRVMVEHGYKLSLAPA